jgi:hypothetical protein
LNNQNLEANKPSPVEVEFDNAVKQIEAASKMTRRNSK